MSNLLKSDSWREQGGKFLYFLCLPLFAILLVERWLISYIVYRREGGSSCLYKRFVKKRTRTFFGLWIVGVSQMLNCPHATLWCYSPLLGNMISTYKDFRFVMSFSQRKLENHPKVIWLDSLVFHGVVTNKLVWAMKKFDEYGGQKMNVRLCPILESRCVDKRSLGVRDILVIS